MAHPLLYEINTRCWLNELSVTLADVPDDQFQSWKSLGFTHIWLIGVWKTGARARIEALRTPDQRKHYSEALPDYRDEDVQGSPYAIADYSVPEVYGGDAGLASFRRKLNGYGLKLVLDFVPNHLGLDYRWVKDQPDLFVQAPFAAPDTFQEETSLGTRWLAHGRDPYFPPWTDTVQVDYRRRATQAAMLDLLGRVAERCDGVRCDMAMLLLNDVFADTWKQYPTADPKPNFEFWQLAISTIKARHPEFLFLAEVYWGLESRLQSLGFDYTYDKELYDRVVAYDGPGVQRHLLKVSPDYLAASAHFLENHDESRIASVLPWPQHRAAAVLMLVLPGMRFLHEGQLTGTQRRVPVQLVRRLHEPVNREIAAFYQQLLKALPQTFIGNGEARILKPERVTNTDSSWEKMVVIDWNGREGTSDVIAVNLSDEPGKCRVSPGKVLKIVASPLAEIIGSEGMTINEGSLLFELPPDGVGALRIGQT